MSENNVKYCEEDGRKTQILLLSLHAFFYYHPRTLKCFGGRGVPRGRLNSRGRLNDLGAGGYLADA